MLALSLTFCSKKCYSVLIIGPINFLYQNLFILTRIAGVFENVAGVRFLKGCIL